VPSPSRPSASAHLRFAAGVALCFRLATDRTLRIHRTIADLAGSVTITHAHLAEALQYRPKLGFDVD